MTTGDDNPVPRLLLPPVSVVQIARPARAPKSWCSSRLKIYLSLAFEWYSTHVWSHEYLRRFMLTGRTCRNTAIYRSTPAPLSLAYALVTIGSRKQHRERGCKGPISLIVVVVAYTQEHAAVAKREQTETRLKGPCLSRAVRPRQPCGMCEPGDL